MIKLVMPWPRLLLPFMMLGKRPVPLVKRPAMNREGNSVKEFEAEIEGLEAQLNNSLAIFSDLEMERYEKFYQKHFKLHNDGRYKKDPGITFHMIGTGIGTCYTVECPICHEKEDITDVSSW